MRILLDECVNPRLRRAFPGHEVQTVTVAKWRALPDAALIVQADSQCDVLVTIDQGFEFQHNLKKVSFGIVIVHVNRNRMEFYEPIFAELLVAVQRVASGEVVHVGRPRE